MNRTIEAVKYTIRELESMDLENINVIALDDAINRLREYVYLLEKIDEATVGPLNSN